MMFGLFRHRPVRPCGTPAQFDSRIFGNVTNFFEAIKLRQADCCAHAASAEVRSTGALFLQHLLNVRALGRLARLTCGATVALDHREDGVRSLKVASRRGH